jgi:hypothetical protein
MSLLNRYDQIQSREFGTNTALSDGNQNGVGGAAGDQMRARDSRYSRALRLLDRMARKGNANAAIKAIDIQGGANNEGYSPGGIRRKDEADAGIIGRINTMEQGAFNRNQAARAFGQGAADASAANPGAGVDAQNMDAAAMMGPPKPTRVGAALDLLEGAQTYGSGGDAAQYNTGLQTAQNLGVANPTSILGGDTQLKYRQTLDQALGAAQSPTEIAALRDRGKRFGVPVESFNRRAKWWETNRI